MVARILNRPERQPGCSHARPPQSLSAKHPADCIGQRRVSPEYLITLFYMALPTRQRDRVDSQTRSVGSVSPYLPQQIKMTSQGRGIRTITCRSGSAARRPWLSIISSDGKSGRGILRNVLPVRRSTKLISGHPLLPLELVVTTNR